MINKKIVKYEIPTIQELLTTVNYNKCKPATDLEYYIVDNWDSSGENGNEYLWSSTDKIDTTTSAKWIIDFKYGMIKIASGNAKIAVRFKITYDDGSIGWTKVYNARTHNDAVKLMNELNSKV